MQTKNENALFYVMSRLFKFCQCHICSASFLPSSLYLINVILLKAQTDKLMLPTEQGCMHGGADDEISVEESVLQELEMVMTQVDLFFCNHNDMHCDDTCPSI